jgi:hypothetical protein
MKNPGLIALGAAIAVKSVVTVATIRSIRKEGKQERAKIQSDLQKDLEALHTAKGIVLERVRNNHYTSTDQLLNDIRFETLVNREEM